MAIDVGVKLSVSGAATVIDELNRVGVAIDKVGTTAAGVGKVGDEIKRIGGESVTAVTGAGRLGEEVKKIGTTGPGVAKVSDEIKRVGGEAVTAVTGTGKLSEEVKKIGGAGPGVSKVSDEIKRVGGEALGSATGSDKLAAALGRAAHYGLAGGAMYATAQAIGSVGKALFDASAQAQNLITQLNFASGGNSAREMAFVADMANRLGLEVASTAKAYAGFAAASRGTAIEGQKARNVFESISMASAVMGLSTDQASGALLAVQQMMSKGVVSAEEFRGQLGERMPIALAAGAQALGVTTAEFSKLLETGQIVAADFLPKFGDAIKSMIGGASEEAAARLEGSTNRMGNAWTKLKQTIGDSGVAQGIANSMGWLTEDMNAVSESMNRAAKQGSGFFGQMNEGLGQLIGRAFGLQYLNRDFMTLDRAVADATATLKRLNATELKFGGLSIYQMSERATAIRDLARANRELEASNRGNAVGGGRGNINPETVAQAEMLSNKLLSDKNALLLKMAGVSDGYIKDMQEIIRLNQAGVLVGKEYNDALAKQQEILLKKSAQKVIAAGNPFEAEQNAAKVWAKVVEDAAAITAKATASTEGWTEAQRKLVEYLADPAYKTNSQAMNDLAESVLRGAMAAEHDAAVHKLWAEARKKAYDEVVKATAQAVQAATSSAESVAKSVQGMQDEEAALRMAAALNISLAQALERVHIARLQEQANAARADNNQELLDQLNAEIKSRRELATLEDRKAARSAPGTDVGSQLGDGFDKASQSLSAFVKGFTGLLKLQEDYNDARKRAGGDAALHGQIDAKNLRDNVKGYATLAGAAKGFFGENTTGYKLMDGAEKAFRAMEMAMAIEAALLKVGLFGTVAAASVAGQAVETSGVIAGEAVRNTAKVPGVFMSFMSALGPWGAAAAGVAIAAVLGGAFSGGGGGAAPVTNQGTGTVFGDDNAKSDSIAKAIKALEAVDTMTMRYSAQMLDSLRNIEASIGGLTNLILRAGGVEAAAAGISTGFKPDAIGGLMSGVSGVAMGASIGLMIAGPIGAAVGALLGPLVGKLFGSSTSITGQGITAAPQTLGSIAAGGMGSAAYYADTKTSNKFFGITYGTDTGAQVGAPDSELNQQFSLIFKSFNAAMQAAAGPLGVALGDVNGRLSSFIIDLGKINLQDLTGAQIQEKLTAVFGAAGDGIARAALPGLDLFQKVGEGYFETVVRVATGVETAQAALARLGVTAVSFADIANKQGDVAAEMVRQSLVFAETRALTRVSGVFGPNPVRSSDGPATGLTGIGEIINTLGGSAADLAAAYQALTDVRSALYGLGIDGAAVTTSLLQGAGGLQALQDSLSSFRSNFLTEAQQLALSTTEMTDRFALLGLALPASGDAFVALVQGINTSTESGQKLLGQVLSLSDGFAVLNEHVKAVASERQGLQSQLDQLTLTSAELLKQQRDALDESNRALFDQIQVATSAKKVQDELTASTAAAEAATAARVAAVLAEKTGLQAQLDQLTLTSAELLKQQRDALDESNRALFDQIQVATSAKKVQDELTAATAAAEAATAARVAAVLAEKTGLQSQLDQLTLTSVELLKQQRDALDESNRALFDQIQTATAAKLAQDELTASTAAAAAAATAQAAAILSERQGLQSQLDQLTLTSAQLLTQQRDALDSSNRALFDQVQAATAAKTAQDELTASTAAAAAAATAQAAAILSERQGLQSQLDQLTLTSAELLKQQRDALDSSNRSLFDQIQAATAAKVAQDELTASTAAAAAAATAQAAAILSERQGLQSQLDQLTLTSAQLLTQQRDALDSSNRALFDQIQAATAAKVAQDELTASTAAAAAAATAQAAAILSERQGLQSQLDQLTLTSAELLKQQRDALDESNRALFDQIQAATAAKVAQDELTASTAAAAAAATAQAAAILSERQGLQSQLDQLTLTSAELLKQQRDALDESNRALFDQVQAATAAKTAQDELTASTVSWHRQKNWPQTDTSINHEKSTWNLSALSA